MISAEKSVYISYSWGAEKRHPLVDELLAALAAQDIEVKRDSNAINYGDSIRAYMNELAAGRAIILVLSEEYFKSPNCMYELREIYLNNRKDFRKRIFPVVFEKTPLHSPEDQILYIDYWEKKTKKFDNNLDLISKRNVSHDLLSKLKEYDDFAKMIGDLQALISDMYCPKEEELRKTGFASLIERMLSHDTAAGGIGMDIGDLEAQRADISDAHGSIGVNITNAHAPIHIHLPGSVSQPKEKTDVAVAPAHLGTLFNVPNLPPNYLERNDDLKEVRTILLAKETRRQHVGVLGMGGLGKSVIAAALARDKDVRAAFPDGIFWLTFGQHPDEARLLELQAGILRHIPPGQQPEALDHGATLLSLALEDRHCLLIADDLWDSRHLRHFPLGGDGSCFLLTTRDAEVIKKIGAHPCKIGLLSDPQARKLLAECSGYDENALPDEAAVIVQECGHLPLAIAAVGSMVMDESADFWQIVLKRLQTARLDKIPANVTIDYDYDDLFKVFHISVDALPQEVQAYYKTLLVFPEDEKILTSVLQLYWKHCHQSDSEPLEVISILVKRSLLSRVDDNLVALHDLLRDYLTYQYGGDVASLHKQLLEAYKAEYPGGWHTIPYEATDYMLSASGYFHRQWKNHAQKAGDPVLIYAIADTFIRHQPWRDLQNISNLLEEVDYQLIDIAPHLLKNNKQSDVLIACLKIIGLKAKEDAKRLLKEHQNPLLISACFAILGTEAKEDALRLLKESNQPNILIACLKIIGLEAKEDVKRLLKEHQNPLLISACFAILGTEAKEDAKRLLKESQHPHVLSVCLKVLGYEAKEDARRFLQEKQHPDVMVTCLNILGNEAKDDAKRLLNERKEHQIITTCLKVLGDEAKEDAKRLFNESDDESISTTCLNILGDEAKENARQMLKDNHPPDVISKCLNMLGDEAKDDARRLIKESKYNDVLTVCLKILGEEARDDAKRLLKESKYSLVWTACLKVLGDEGKKDARRLLKSSKEEILLLTCIQILGKEAEADAKRLINNTRNRITRDACREIVSSWSTSLGGRYPELARLKKNDADE